MSFDRKLWVQKLLNQVAINRTQEVIQNTGRALPCRVVAVNEPNVTVAFSVDSTPWTLPQITIPKAESPWLRMPTQVGDTGITIPSDVFLGGISGLGGGTANLSSPGNLAALIFLPVSNGSGPVDANAAQIQGPNGVISQTTQGTTSKVVTNQSGTTITFGTTSIQVTASSVVISVGGQTFTFNASSAVSTVPMTAPDITMPNGSVNNHNHTDPQGGVVGPMQG